MKSNRGYKLGRPLMRAWRWLVRRPIRRRPTRYLRLDPESSCHGPPLPPPKHNLSTSPLAPMAAKLFHWGRHLTGRLGRSTIGGGDEESRAWCAAAAPLLEGGREPRWAPPPKGHLAVYVGGCGGAGKDEGGPPWQRYTVPVIYFNHPLFGELLREAEQEFGFHHPGGITIPCPAAEFERVWTLIAAASDGRKPRRLAPF